MNKELLKPVELEAFDYDGVGVLGSIGSRIQIYSEEDSFPDLDGVKVVILGVEEGRNAIGEFKSDNELYKIRRQFYKLFFGAWDIKIADIGNIILGDDINGTYFAVKQVVGSLMKRGIIPVILGGSQDITYAHYRAYDDLEQMVNLTSVDSRFDLGSDQEELTSRSFLGKIIVDKPNNLFNYSNLGYQTYFNSQEEINLLEKMYFDLYRLGDLQDITLVEPVMRDTDMVSIDISSIRQSDSKGCNDASVNGFFGKEICAIARYAGISDKVTSFGVYEYIGELDERDQTAGLIAQMLWYFIEGVDNRAYDYPFATKDSYQKFIVLLENDDPINFYKSDKSGRWWMEVNLISDNKYKRHTLIPCTYEDYLQALEQKIPERWYKALKKLT